ncbi:MAG: glycosyltransferase family 2 protein [Ignavibacteria bacterium]|nr:glycosyltransferase family 2 protein [Ignavibacteria bacterium]
MKLSVIIPVYNEVGTIRAIVEKVRAVPLEKEIIIVNDASTDGTKEELARIEKKFPELKIFHHEKNKGKGGAVHTGISTMSGEVMLIQDADLELDPNDYPALIQPIEEKKTSVVYGSRELGIRNQHLYFSFYLGGKMVSWFANILYGSSLTDAPTGYKVLRSDVVKSLNLRCERFDFDPEITAKVLKRGITIIEVPISYYPRTKEAGKKIGWKDGIVALWTLLKYKFIT